MYLVEVDDGEAVGLSLSHAGHTEVEPLGVLVGVEVKAQVELIVPSATACGCVSACGRHVTQIIALYRVSRGLGMRLIIRREDPLLLFFPGERGPSPAFLGGILPRFPKGREGTLPHFSERVLSRFSRRA